jgi:hypothetical protein
MARKKLFYCREHDSVISCSLCEGIFEGGSVKDLAEKISDHEVRGKLVDGHFKFDLIEFGNRAGGFTPALTKLYKEGRQEVGRWVEIEPNMWYREEIPQEWEWYS